MAVLAGGLIIAVALALGVHDLVTGLPLQRNGCLQILTEGILGASAGGADREGGGSSVILEALGFVMRCFRDCGGRESDGGEFGRVIQQAPDGLARGADGGRQRRIAILQ